MSELNREELIGRLFRTRRKAAKLTLKMMAGAMGMSINTIRCHEAGTRLLRVDDIYKAAGILGCDKADLLVDDCHAA